MATLHGWPALDDVLPALHAAGNRRVHLMPFLLGAGAHACRNLAGQDPASWQTRLRAAGFTVRCTLRGLGSLPGIQQLYCQKFKQAAGGL